VNLNAGFIQQWAVTVASTRKPCIKVHYSPEIDLHPRFGRETAVHCLPLDRSSVIEVDIGNQYFRKPNNLLIDLRDVCLLSCLGPASEKWIRDEAGAIGQDRFINCASLSSVALSLGLIARLRR
jgi:hypothetical protein